MQKTEQLGWIEILLARQPYSCSEPDHVHLRQGWVRERIAGYVAAYENGCELLHSACCATLQHDDASRVENALTCLFVVGAAADVAAVEPLLKHPDESVRKAAKTCLFEIRRRRD